MTNDQFLDKLADAIIAANARAEKVEAHLVQYMIDVDRQIIEINKRLDYVEGLGTRITQQADDMADLVASVTGLPAIQNAIPSRIGDRLTALEQQLGIEGNPNDERIEALETEVVRLHRLVPELKPVTKDDVIATLKDEVAFRRQFGQ